MLVLTNEGNPNTLKLIIAAKIAQQSITVKTVNPNECPLARLPVLQLRCGTNIFSTSAAMQFLASKEGSSIMNKKWLEWDISQLQPAVVSCGSIDVRKNADMSYLWSLLNILNTSLDDSGYLIKEENRISLADISIWVTLWSTIVVADMEKEISKEFPHISSWLAKIETLPVVQESLKEFTVERGPKATLSIQVGSWFPINSSANPRPNICKSVASDINTKEKEIESVSQEEISNVSTNWGLKTYPDVKQCSYLVLPKKGERNILVTSALPYVNNVPHLGNIIGCVLSADIFARYCRQRNYNTLYISGTDEYGTATEAKAIKENTTPQSICDKFFNIHNDVYRWFSIGFDYFGRTTTPEQTDYTLCVVVVSGYKYEFISDTSHISR